jgi:hypothetical protein
MKSTTLGPVVLRTSIALACLAFGPHPSAVSKSGPALHISGRSLDAKGVYAGPVDIYIERWSTDEERDKVAGPMMSKSPSALLAVLEKVRVRAGYVLTPGIQATGLRALGRRAWNIDFAREITTPGGRRIIIASQDHLPIGEFPKDVAARGGPQHEVDVLDIRFAKDGKGVGKLADVKKIAFNDSIKTIEIAKYDAEPVRLADVTAGPVKTRVTPPKEYSGKTR